MPDETKTLTDEEVAAAAKELKAETQGMESEPIDVFVAQLQLWYQHETSKNMARESYELQRELSGGDPDSLVQQYALAKKALLAIERKLKKTLTMMEQDTQRAALQSWHLVPGQGTIRCPKPLRDRLEKALAGRAGEE